VGKKKAGGRGGDQGTPDFNNLDGREKPRLRRGMAELTSRSGTGKGGDSLTCVD